MLHFFHGPFFVLFGADPAPSIGAGRRSFADQKKLVYL
jgi:hypothetical protein